MLTMSEEDEIYSEFSNKLHQEYSEENCQEGEEYDEKFILNEMLIQGGNTTCENPNDKNYSAEPIFPTTNEKSNNGYEYENEYKLVELGRIESGFCEFGLLPGQPVYPSYLHHAYALRQGEFCQQECGYYSVQGQAPGWQAEDSSRCGLFARRGTKMRVNDDSSVTPSSSTGTIKTKL